MTDGATAPIARTGGRVILRDQNGHVLLIHERLDGGGSHWLTPGGGLEPGETPAQAAVRETIEETGIELAIAPGTQPVLTTRRTWSWSGVTFDQTDSFFLVDLDHRPPVQPRALTEVERAILLGHRWWPPAELAGTADTIEPPGLADRLAELGTPPLR